jgi:hypothetical protein
MLWKQCSDLTDSITLARQRPTLCSYEYGNDPAVFIKFQEFLDLATTTVLPRKTYKVVFSKEFLHILIIQPYIKCYDER